MKKINYLSLAFSVILVETLGSIGSIFSTKSLDNWYLKLVKPYLNPPNWVFAPVWTLLFLLMGVSLYLVFSKKTKKTKQQQIALKLFALQFAFNILWSYFFFGLKSPLYGLLDITLLLLSLALTMLSFERVDKSAALLLVPYFLWVTFACYLNLSVYLLNR